MQHGDARSKAKKPSKDLTLRAWAVEGGLPRSLVEGTSRMTKYGCDISRPQSFVHTKGLAATSSHSTRASQCGRWGGEEQRKGEKEEGGL